MSSSVQSQYWCNNKCNEVNPTTSQNTTANYRTNLASKPDTVTINGEEKIGKKKGLSKGAKWGIAMGTTALVAIVLGSIYATKGKSSATFKEAFEKAGLEVKNGQIIKKDSGKAYTGTLNVKNKKDGNKFRYSNKYENGYLKTVESEMVGKKRNYFEYIRSEDGTLQSVKKNGEIVRQRINSSNPDIIGYTGINNSYVLRNTKTGNVLSGRTDQAPDFFPLYVKDKNGRPLKINGTISDGVLTSAGVYSATKGEEKIVDFVNVVAENYNLPQGGFVRGGTRCFEDKTGSYYVDVNAIQKDLAPGNYPYFSTDLKHGVSYTSNDQSKEIIMISNDSSNDLGIYLKQNGKMRNVGLLNPKTGDETLIENSGLEPGEVKDIYNKAISKIEEIENYGKIYQEFDNVLQGLCNKKF